RWTGTDDGDIDVGDEFDVPLAGPDDEAVLVDASLVDDAPTDLPDSTDDTESTDD
ncbi:MAG: segregation/condensation protein, partial [Aeromicrobium sp.]|nr:segregation/condensation protein [Aeromicrobium sp.]